MLCHRRCYTLAGITRLFLRKGGRFSRAMGGQAAKKRRAELRECPQQQAAAAGNTAGLYSAAVRTHGPDAGWIDCGYCKTFHVACCGFASADDADASRHHPNGDRKWVSCSLCGVPHAKRCDWDGAGEDSDLYDLTDVDGCAVCAGPLEDDAWDCDACGESVCNGCMAYLNMQDHIAICGDCVGTWLRRLRSQLERGGGRRRRYRVVGRHPRRGRRRRGRRSADVPRLLPRAVLGAISAPAL